MGAPALSSRIETLEALHGQAEQQVRLAVTALKQAEDREARLRNELATIRDEVAAREQPVTRKNKESVWRSAVRIMGGFTADELAAEVGTSKQTARAKLKEYEGRGIVKQDGKVGAAPYFVFVKPDDAGPEARAQQDRRLAPVPSLPKSAPVAGTGRNLLVALPKEYKGLVSDCMNNGWNLSAAGNGHFKLTKGGRTVTVVGTPRNAGAHADQLRRGIKAAEREMRT